MLRLEDLGAKPGEDCAPAFRKAFSLQPKGGTIVCGPGEFYVDCPIEPPSNTVIAGAGGEATIFNGRGVADNIFVLTAKYRIQLRDIYVTQARSNGVAAFRHRAPEYPQHINSPHHSIARVISRFNGAAGFFISDGYAIHFEQSFAGDNASSGFHMPGFHTSLKFELCGASNNNDGFYFENAVYCSFDTCHTDDNRLYGYNVRNAQAIGFRSCGGERNKLGMFLFQSNPLHGNRQLTGIKVQECFGIENGGPSSFIEAHAVDGFSADITVQDCVDDSSPSGCSIYTNAAAVTIRRTGGKFAGTIPS